LLVKESYSVEKKGMSSGKKDGVWILIRHYSSRTKIVPLHGNFNKDHGDHLGEGSGHNEERGMQTTHVIVNCEKKKGMGGEAAKNRKSRLHAEETKNV